MQNVLFFVFFCAFFSLVFNLEIKVYFKPIISNFISSLILQRFSSRLRELRELESWKLKFALVTNYCLNIRTIVKY